MTTIVSVFVIGGTLLSILAFFLILQMNKSTSHPGQTTGHDYDGIEEYDNPLPSWWYWKFVITIIFGLGYLIYYPGLGNWEGVSGWTSRGQLEAEQEKADAKYGPIFAQYAEVPLDELAKDATANKMGRRLFVNNCAVCHGANAEGSYGFPNLTDSEWIWGGDDTAIHTTILQGRNAAMPAWGDLLGEDGVEEVAEYVLSLSGRDVDAALVEKGKTHFQTYCIACHGPEGTGNPMFGAPNLTNDMWLYGSSRQRIQHIVRNGRNGQMPSFEAKLGKDKVHIVAAYVKSLQQQ